MIGDIACDPTSTFSPVKVYDRVTDWTAPALRVHAHPPLDVTAIDNLPSLLPVESSTDYAGQLLPSLLRLDAIADGVWGHAKAEFDHQIALPRSGAPEGQRAGALPPHPQGISASKKPIRLDFMLSRW